MIKDPKQEKLISNIIMNLDNSVENLDDDVLSRLDEMRMEALSMPRHTSNSVESMESLVMAARVALDDSTGTIEPEVNQRLDQLRKMALNQPQELKPNNPEAGTLSFLGQIRKLFENRRFSVPASGFATACVMVTMIALVYQAPDPDRMQSVSEEIMLFASTDEIELYENLEFYQWLADSGLPE